MGSVERNQEIPLEEAAQRAKESDLRVARSFGKMGKAISSGDHFDRIVGRFIGGKNFAARCFQANYRRVGER